MMSISDTLRRAVKDSGLTVYQICKDTGLIQDSLRRFMSGETSMRLDLADKLANYLDIECRQRRRKGK